MTEKELDIETPDGLMNTFITYPDEGGPYPVAPFLMDAMGKRNELHDMAAWQGLVTMCFFPTSTIVESANTSQIGQMKKKRWKSCLAI
jgi:hypothetical protein